MLDKRIKDKVEQARQAYFAHLGKRDIEYTITVFKEQDWEGGDEREATIYSQERTFFFGQVMRKIESLVGKEGIGDIVVSHGETKIFMIWHYKGKVSMPKKSQSERCFAD